MKFKYIAFDSQNKKQEGYVQASSKNEAIGILKESKLKIISLESEKSNFFKEKIASFWEGISDKEFVIFSRQLAILIDSNVPLLQALRAIAVQTDSNYFSIRIQQIIADIEGGLSMSEALIKHPDTFSRFFVNMVKAGEISGNLQKSLNDLADNIEKNYDLSNKLKSAMYYPGFIFSVMILVGFTMMTFVVPKLLEILKETDVVLPIQTRILIWTSDIFAAYWWAIGPAIIGVIMALVYYVKTEDGRREYDQLILKIPVMNKLLKSIYIARFSENLTSLLKSGLTINVALMITSDVIGNEVYREAIREVVVEIKKGGKIGEAFEHYGIFPPIVTQMIRVGESTGRIDYTLSRITKFYTKESDTMVKNLSSFMEPVIMVILAIGVGILVSAILLPIYQVSSSIK